MFKSEGGRIHEGHRGRMREKLLVHGSRIFDTYELLEMLLYYVIPYKDTNPIAKRLLAAFGSLEGVLNADKEELQRVDGIGPRAADFIRLAGVLTEKERFFSAECERVTMDSYDETGRFLAVYFKNNETVDVVQILMDDSMRVLSIEQVKGKNFGSAEIKVKAFIDPAIRHHATVSIIAHCHRFGPDFPTESERVTSKMVREGLSQIGVRVAEHYVISGDKYCGISTDFSYRFNSKSPELARFLKSKGEGGV